MSDRRLVDRRTFLKVIVGGGFALGCAGKNRTIPDEVVSGDTLKKPDPVSGQSYKILVTEVDLWQLNPSERRIYSAIRSRPPELLPTWEPQYIPTYLNIFAIGISMPIQPVTATGYRRTPDEGIATDVPGYFPNIHIYGHSSLKGVPQEFGNIVNLNRGNLILLNNDANVPNLFAVVDFTIDDVNQEIGPSDELTLILQATLKESDRFKMNQRVAVGKASKVAGGANLNFYVWARPVGSRVPV